MYSQIHKKAVKNNPNFLWKLQTVHINEPIYIKNIQEAVQERKGKHYVPWLSLVAINI